MGTWRRESEQQVFTTKSRSTLVDHCGSRLVCRACRCRLRESSQPQHDLANSQHFHNPAFAPRSCIESFFSPT
jgi:ferredoxin